MVENVKVTDHSRAYSEIEQAYIENPSLAPVMTISTCTYTARDSENMYIILNNEKHLQNWNII